jgi:hypothetical protein
MNLPIIDPLLLWGQIENGKKLPEFGILCYVEFEFDYELY